MSNQQPTIQFLKLGGSLITDKFRPATPRFEVLSRLAGEIASAKEEQPELHLLLGHGSGSFGHVAAKKYGTRQGVRGAEGWAGFAEVWRQAAALNHLVMEALHAAGIPAIAFPASAGSKVRDGAISDWELSPLKAALEAGLLPVVYGDVAFDELRGGTILSTEDIFQYLAIQLQPQHILLAGLEPGVWADYPTCTQLVEEITPAKLGALAPGLSSSDATDVTGGMASKVKQMLELVEQLEGLEVLIFSGEKEGNVREALLGEKIGTRIHGGIS